MRKAIVLTVCGALTSACGSGSNGGAHSADMGTHAGGADGQAAGAGNQSGSGTGASAGAPGSSGGPVVLPPATGTPGVWERVTPAEAPAALFSGDNGFGMGSIVTDPSRPTDLYVGGYGSLWRSTDYGLHWSMLTTNPTPPPLALGHVLAVAGTTPPTIWMATVNGAQHVYKSTDGGMNFTMTGTIAEQPDAASLYSFVIDPNDATHLLSGLHEQDKVLESTDGGETWKFVSGAGWPTGGISWFPFFIDTGDAATTRKTWFAIAQDGGSAVMTSDGGQTWAMPKGIEKLQHPHGDAGFYQNGKTLFTAGIYATAGNGIFRSTDLGANWQRVGEGNAALVWGSAKNLYEMWGWACASCTFDKGGSQYLIAEQPGDTWSTGTLPDALTWGPNSVATTSDGSHTIFVGSMWSAGLWRYVEP